MNGRFKPTQVEFPTHLTGGSPTGDAIDAAFHHPAALQPSLGRRVLRKLGRLLVIFCLGVCSTLAWQSYGDTARAMIAKSSPQLGWVAPQPVPVVPPAAQETAPASASPEFQQLAFALAALRQNVDLLTTQIAAGQQQMAGEIAKLRTDEQEILRKVSTAASRPPAQKPIAAGPAASPPASPQAR